MADFASYIDVPAADIAEGRVYAPVRSPDQERMFPSFLRVRNGDAAPVDAHVAVRYRDRWFWIDDRDEQSKVSLNFLMFIFSLAETGATPADPLVMTIQAR